jgi:hypothetical protein
MNSIMSFIILYRDHKTIGFRDLVKRPPIAIRASKNQGFLTSKNKDILKEKTKSIPQYHHCLLATLLPRVDLVTRPSLKPLPPLSIPLAALLAARPALRLELGAEGSVRRWRACDL